MRKRAVLPSLALVLALGVPVPAHFGERTDSLWGFVTRSHLVAIATVIRTQRFEEKGHTTVPGAVRLRVEEVLHGEAPGSKVGILVEGMHQPRYTDGERVLVFAERHQGTLRSLQSRSEKVSLKEKSDPVLDAVRRYVRIREEETPRPALKQLTLELLSSPLPRLHQDAVFDLSRRGLLDPFLDDEDVAALGTLAAAETSPLVVREGIAAKLGVLFAAGHRSARPPLERLALHVENPAVRVAAVRALIRGGSPSAARILTRAASDENVHVRRAAVEGLGRLAEVRGLPVLDERLRDADPRVRFEAVKALLRIGVPEATTLLRSLDTEEDQRFVARAQEEIRRTTPQTKREEPR